MGSLRRGLNLFAVLGILLGGWPGSFWAQTPPPLEVRIEPEQPGLGEVFLLEIRLPDGDGGTLRGPPTLPGIQGGKQLTGPSFEPAGGSKGLPQLRYTFLALRPGFRPLPTLLLERASAGDTIFRPVQVQLGGVQVRSVLPPPGDPVDIPPLLGPEAGETRTWPNLPLSLAGTLIFGVAWVWARHGGSEHEGPAPDDGESDKGEAGEHDPLNRLQVLALRSGDRHTDREPDLDEVSEILRDWLRRRHPVLKSSYTVDELEARLGSHPDGDVARLLRRGDAIRFGGKPAPAKSVEMFWAEIVAWRGGHDA